jgi:hypothetical protein
VHRHIAVEKLIRLLRPVMDYFRDERDGRSAEATRIYESLCDARVLVALYAVGDILQPVQRLQKRLQERGLSVYGLLKAREECTGALDRMRHGPGGVVVPRAALFLQSCTDGRSRRGERVKLAFDEHELSDFPAYDGLQDALQETGVTAFLETLCSSLNERFREECDAVVEKLKVLDPAAFDGTDWTSGQAELADIGNHFSDLVLPEQCYVRINRNQLLADWARFKLTEEYKVATGKGERPDYCASQETFWGHFFLRGSGSREALMDLAPADRYCELFKVVALAIVIITNNAEGERAFSCMNRICTDERSSLSVDHVEDQMLISRGAKLGMTGELPEFHRHRFNFEEVWRSFAREKLRRPGDMAPIGSPDDSRQSKMERRGPRPRTKGAKESPAQARREEPEAKQEEKEEEEEEEEEEEVEDDPRMTEVVGWGEERETIQFYHEKVDQRLRSDVVGWSFQDEGDFWVILELGYAIKRKKLFILYISRDRLNAIFPGQSGETPTFTEVFRKLEAQTRAMPEEQRAEADELPLDTIQWSLLSEARKLGWLPERSAKRRAATT